MKRAFLVSAIIGVMLIVVSLLNDPSLMILSRKSDRSHLIDSLPDTRSSDFTSFEGLKITPLEEYHSGFKNQVFYLLNKKKAKFRLEFYSRSERPAPVDIIFILNHEFIKPRFIQSGLISESKMVYRFIPKNDEVFSVEFELSGLNSRANEFCLIINSIIDPYYRPQAQETRLNVASVFHTNIVGLTYDLPDLPAALFPNVSNPIPGKANDEVIILKKGKSLAIVNERENGQDLVVCQASRKPTYLRVGARQSATFRNLLVDPNDPIVVLGDPFKRIENRFGEFQGAINQAFFYRIN